MPQIMQVQGIRTPTAVNAAPYTFLFAALIVFSLPDNKL
jgi:hypothetical protein